MDRVQQMGRVVVIVIVHRIVRIVVTALIHPLLPRQHMGPSQSPAQQIRLCRYGLHQLNMLQAM